MQVPEQISSASKLQVKKQLGRTKEAPLVKLDAYDVKSNVQGFPNTDFLPNYNSYTVGNRSQQIQSLNTVVLAGQNMTAPVG